MLIKNEKITSENKCPKRT